MELRVSCSVRIPLAWFRSLKLDQFSLRFWHESYLSPLTLIWVKQRGLNIMNYAATSTCTIVQSAKCYSDVFHSLAFSVRCVAEWAEQHSSGWPLKGASRLCSGGCHCAQVVEPMVEKLVPEYIINRQGELQIRRICHCSGDIRHAIWKRKPSKWFKKSLYLCLSLWLFSDYRTTSPYKSDEMMNSGKQRAIIGGDD